MNLNILIKGVLGCIALAGFIAYLWEGMSK